MRATFFLLGGTAAGQRKRASERERERERERKISMGVPAYGEAALREHVAAAAGARGSLPLSRRCAV